MQTSNDETMGGIVKGSGWDGLKDWLWLAGVMALIVGAMAFYWYS